VEAPIIPPPTITTSSINLFVKVEAYHNLIML